MNDALAVLVHRLGPYHLARLRAVAALGPMVAVEYSSADSTYQWDAVSSTGAFRTETLFSQTEVQAETIQRTRARVTEVLDAVAPSAVAIPGWSARASLLALEWCLNRKVPAVVMSESQASDERRTVAREYVKRRLIRLFSAALVGGVAHQRYLEALGLPPDRIVTGYDVVDNEHFARGADAARADGPNVRQVLGLPERYFLASSRFIPKKNLERLLQGYSAYRRSVGARAWKLVILGDGALRASLLAQRERLALTEDVLLPGFKQYEDLPKFYGLARAFVHASTVEQWGLVVNEAMAAGLPVLVSSRCGCVPELVHEGVNGHAFDPSNADELAECLLRMSSGVDDVTAMGNASREIVSRWTPQGFARSLHASVAAARKRPAPRPSFVDRIVLRAAALR